jgi:predicted alpha-1,6-mannanase (GH76 family)
MSNRCIQGRRASAIGHRIFALCFAGALCTNVVAVEICQYGVCDGTGDPGAVLDEKVLTRCPRGGGSPSLCATTRLELHISEKYGMGWASIHNVPPGTRVWMDRSFDPPRANDPGRHEQLGVATVPPGNDGWRTMMSFYAPGLAQIRACGDPGGAAVCTGWFPVCEAGNCDGKDPAGARERATNPVAWVWDRKITLHIADDVRMAWASIENGKEHDSAWLDRSWTDGSEWDGQLGYAEIPPTLTAWRGWMFHFNDRPHGGAGLLRACGRAADRPETVCTPWVRATEQAPDNLHGAAVDVLVAQYDKMRGSWSKADDPHWWWEPNALLAVIEYMWRTGDRRHIWMIDHALTKNVRQDGSFDPGHYKGFDNDYLDDSAWWGLAWLRAYDLTEDPLYLQSAKSVADWMWVKGWDTSVCGGGLWWRQEPPLLWPKRGGNAKNAITNELFIKLAASLHNRIPGDTVYLRRASKVWSWFQTSGLLAEPGGLVWDGLYDPIVRHDSRCEGFWKFTYSQGVLLGALAELHRATGDEKVIQAAERIANTAIDIHAPPDETFVFTAEHPHAGILREICEQVVPIDQSPPGCLREKGMEDDMLMFKGVFVRNLRELHDHNRAAGRSTFTWAPFLKAQTASLANNARSGWAQFGFRWTGPVGALPIGAANDIDYSTQTIAVHAFNAASGLE